MFGYLVSVVIHDVGEKKTTYDLVENKHSGCLFCGLHKRTSFYLLDEEGNCNQNEAMPLRKSLASSNKLTACTIFHFTVATKGKKGHDYNNNYNVI